MPSEKFPFSDPRVTCLECDTQLGGGTTKDPYSHLLLCLRAQPGSFERMREAATSARSENGRRILHILDAIAPVPAPI